MNTKKPAVLKSVILNIVAPLLLVAGGVKQWAALQRERVPGAASAAVVSSFSPTPDQSAGQRMKGRPAPGGSAGYFPNFVLRTQENQPVRFYDDLVSGKVVLINFIYTRCNGT